MNKRRSYFFSTMALLLAVGLAAAAGAAEFKNYPVPEDCLNAIKAEGSVLNIYDWAEWWPEEIYSGFSKEYGVKIVRDNFASEDEMVTKFKLNPKVQYDIMLAGVRPFLQLKALGVLQKLNHAWLPNVVAYLPESTKKAWYDPGHQFTTPTDRFFVGYAYNTKYVKADDARIPSWKLLFDGKDFAGRMTMLDDMYNVIGSALKYLGFSYNTDKEEELAQAKELLMKQKPWVMAYDSWPKRLVLEEEAWISHCWIGEAWFYYQDLKTIRGALPPEGTEVGTDSLLLPKHAPHPAAAHAFMNYVARPDINALLIETIGYTPNHIVTAKLLPDEMRSWPGIDPSDEYVAKCEYLTPQAFTGKGLKLRNQIWEELKK